MNALVAVALAAALSAADLEALEDLAGAWANPSAAADAEARRRFAGRGEALADDFLRHTGGPTRNDAIFVVLRALGEPEAVVALARALPGSPPPASGPLERHWTEIDAAIEAALENERVRREPRVVAAIVAAVGAAREKPGGAPVAEAAVGLLGRCRGAEAVSALRGFARDPDPPIRAAAAQALGWLRAGTEPAPDAGLEPVWSTLAGTLLSDPSAEARRKAAESLGRLGQAAAVEPLRRAVAAERAPEVVDAIVGALERLGAPPTDPALVRDILGRAHEAAAVRALFERWRATASPEDLVAVAATGPLPHRALALEAVTRPAEAPRVRTLPLAAPPTPDGGAVVQAVAPAVSFPGPYDAATPGPPVLDAATRERLAASAVEVLAVPLPHSTTDAAVTALWRLVAGDMREALRRTDAIRDLDQRYWASHHLDRFDPGAYGRLRRRGEWIAAALLAVPFLALLAWPPARRAAPVALAAIAVWGATAPSGGPLGLPPWPFPLVAVRFLTCAAAAAAVVATLRFRRLRPLAAGALAGVVFFAAWTATRELGLYPPDTQSGYVFVFEPLLGTLVAALLTVPLVLVSFRRSRAETA